MDETTVKKIREVAGDFDADDDFFDKLPDVPDSSPVWQAALAGDPIWPGEDSRKDDILLGQTVERERVCEWLRAQAEIVGGGSVARNLLECADAIAAEKHWV